MLNRKKAKGKGRKKGGGLPIGPLLLAGGLFAASQLLKRPPILLKGQAVLVTGGSRGLGLLIAEKFAREGCRVAICARDDEELQRARERLEKHAERVLPIVCNVADQPDVQRMVKRVIDEFGRLDILVNNAGIITSGAMKTLTADDFQTAMQINFFGTLYPILEALPQMLLQKSGRIVNITSIGGKYSAPGMLAYNASKFASVGLSEGLRAELLRENILVTTVVPGLMRTGSYVQAHVKEPEEFNFAAFSAAASLPGISMSAEKAADRIMQAVRRGEAEVTIGLPAEAIARLNGFVPGLVSELSGMAFRAIPAGGQPQEGTEQGKSVQPRVDSFWFKAMTYLNRKAAKDLNQMEPAGHP